METDQLRGWLDRKQAVLSQLCQLAHRQVDFVQQGDMGHLLGLLTAKQKLLQELQQIERQLDPFRDQDPERRQWRSATDRAHARQIAQQCDSLLAEIMQLEKRCETELVRRRDAAANRLQGSHNAAQATEAYAPGHSRRGGRLDISSGK